MVKRLNAKLLIGFGSVLVVLFFPAIFLGKTFYFGDNFSLMIPGKLYLKNSLSERIFPWWNPYLQEGQPFFADINQSILYPFTLLFVLLPLPIALNSTILIHVLISGLGAVKLAESFEIRYPLRWWSGLVFMLSQPVLMATSNLALLQSIAWLPWFLATGIENKRVDLKKKLVYQSLFASLMLLGGHPQVFIYGTAFLLLYVLFFGKHSRLGIAHLGLSLLLTFLSLAILLIPFFELMQLSTRSTMSIREALSDSVNPLHYLDFFIPNLFSDMGTGMTWGIYWNAYRKAGVYITWLGILLVGLFLMKENKTRQEKWLLASGFLSLILALGKFIPGFVGLYEIFSPLKMIRNYSLLLIVWPLFAGVMMAKGMEVLQDKRFTVQKKWFLTGLILVGAFATIRLTQVWWFEKFWLGADAFLHSRLSQSSFHTLDRDRVILGHILSQLSWSGLFLFLSFLGWQHLPKKRMAVLGILISLDLYLANRGLVFLAPASVYETTSPPVVLWLDQQDIEGYRVVSTSGTLPYTGLADYWSNIMAREPFYDSRFDEAEQDSFSELKARRDALAPNWNLPYSLPASNGFSTFVLQSTRNFWQVNKQNENVNEFDVPEFEDRRWDDMGVKYLIFDKTVFDDGAVPEALSRFEVVKEDERTALLLNKAAKPMIQSTREGQQIQDIVMSPNEVSFQTSPLDSPARFTTSLAYYPGWSCTSPEGECQIADVKGFMAVDIPAGAQAVTLKYSPRNLRLALAASVLGVTLLTTLAVVDLKFKRVSIPKKPRV